MATGLKHIESHQVHESALTQVCNSFSIGPLKIDYCVDLTIPQVTFQVYLAGIKIGGGTINPSNPCIKIGGGALGFKAEVELCIDVDRQQVTYEIEICAPFAGCKDYKGVLFSW
ncbi:MAG: hypothetical protein AAF604_06625 [Acidobacteriota bacterium]